MTGPSPDPTPTPDPPGASPAGRVQRRRGRGWRMPPGAVYVGRPTRWGNPLPVAEHGRSAAVARFRAFVLADPVLLAAVRAELAGRPLACWCPLDVACHADALLDLAKTPLPAVCAGGASGGSSRIGGRSR